MSLISEISANLKSWGDEFLFRLAMGLPGPRLPIGNPLVNGAGEASTGGGGTNGLIEPSYLTSAT